MLNISWGVVGLLITVIHTCGSQVWCAGWNCPTNAGCTWYGNPWQRYYCTCKDGYRLNSKHQCVDINECDLGVCGSWGCRNYPGGYDCTGDGCGAGQKPYFTWCTDIDECDFKVCGRTGTCENYAGLYRCRCYSGYRLSGDECIDTDECTGTGPCDTHADCMNLPGSYTCTCNTGYTGDGNSCTDVDECNSTDANNCHPEATCVNEAGGYNCSCQTGFYGNGTECIDVDERNSTDANNCHPEATCVNEADLTGDASTPSSESEGSGENQGGEFSPPFLNTTD